MKPYFVYILQSKLDGSYYVGSTQNVKVRLTDHNAGRGRYTRQKMPWVLVYQETLLNKTAALKRERFIKQQKSRKFIEQLFE